MKSAKRISVCLVLGLFLFLGESACTAGKPFRGAEIFDPPVAAVDAVRTFEIAEGFQVELFAAEPLVTDPVAMEIDESGRVWVVEMPGYPLDVGGSGRVKVLTDTTGDGYPDRASVFADGLVLPKGIMRWKEGVLVTDAPDLLYLEDSMGDGRADVRRVVLTGFARSNPQHNFNKPFYGLDNWIYLANNATIRTDTYRELFGDPGQEIRLPDCPDSPRLPRNAAGRNVRFKPDACELEITSGWSQFGHDFDRWGRHFLVSNAHHQFHEVIPARYLNRNPRLPIHSALDFTPVHGNAARIFPITHQPEHQLLTDVGVMTSASALTWSLGGAFPPGYEEVTFVAEPVHNLVHADRVTARGASFEARRLLEDREFLASTDSWFRPVNFTFGPEGALYVVDYYRRIVEHPQWMDDEVVRTADLYAGRDRGRIFRITAQGTAESEALNRVGPAEASPADLVLALESPNVWWRRHAQRLLVDRRASEALGPLRVLARKGESGEARVHALWTLQGLGALDVELVRQALRDGEAGVRENALRLAEELLEEGDLQSEELLFMADDSSSRVRFQLLLTLGSFERESVRETRRRILFDEIEDEWFQLASLTAVSIDASALLKLAVDSLSERETAGRRTYFAHLGGLVGAVGETAVVRELIREAAGTAGDGWWRAALLEGLARELRGAERDLSALVAERGTLLERFFESPEPGLRRAALEMLGSFGLPVGAGGRRALERAQALALDTDLEVGRRVEALQLLNLGEPARFERLLRSLIDPAEPASVQRAALQALARVPGPEVGRFLLEGWDRMTPEVRNEAVNVFMTEEDRVRLLLDGVEEQRVLVSTIGWPRRVALMRDWSGETRDRARRLLSEDPEVRREVLRQYRAALELRGEPERGREVHRAVCSQCHQIGGELGIPFGPDLGTVRHWAPQNLLAKILDPNRAIADGYEMWMVRRRDARVLSGVIVSESPQAVTLRDSTGIETVVSRSDIESITSTNVSAMPGGLEEQISPQEMADLIAFIRRGG